MSGKVWKMAEVIPFNCAAQALRDASIISALDKVLGENRPAQNPARGVKHLAHNTRFVLPEFFWMLLSSLRCGVTLNGANLIENFGGLLLPAIQNFAGDIYLF